MSGATDHRALCLAAKGKEKRLAELKKRRQYRPEQRSSQTRGSRETRREDQPNRANFKDSSAYGYRRGQTIQCWNCGKTGHLVVDCKLPKRGGSGQGSY